MTDLRSRYEDVERAVCAQVPFEISHVPDDVERRYDAELDQALPTSPPVARSATAGTPFELKTCQPRKASDGRPGQWIFHEKPHEFLKAEGGRYLLAASTSSNSTGGSSAAPATSSTACGGTSARGRRATSGRPTSNGPSSSARSAGRAAAAAAASPTTEVSRLDLPRMLEGGHADRRALRSLLVEDLPWRVGGDRGPRLRRGGRRRLRARGRLLPRPLRPRR